MHNNYLSNIKGLDLPKVGQLGFIIQDSQESLPNFASFFNIDTWFEPIYEEKVFQVGEQELDLDPRLLFAFSGKLQLELIEASAHGEHIYARHMEIHGEGLHHLGFYVSDYDDKLDRINKLGLPILMHGKFKTAGGGKARFAYLDTSACCGIILEIIEVKLFGINLPQNEFFWNIGTFTGDGVKIKVKNKP